MLFEMLMFYRTLNVPLACKTFMMELICENIQTIFTKNATSLMFDRGLNTPLTFYLNLGFWISILFQWCQESLLLIWFMGLCRKYKETDSTSYLKNWVLSLPKTFWIYVLMFSWNVSRTLSNMEMQMFCENI